MVTIPAAAWRGGRLCRSVTIGVPAGLIFGVLGWLDSGALLVGGIVAVVVGAFYGIWMSRRMAQYWVGSANLTGDERVEVVRAARRGERIDDQRLAQPVADYTRGLHAAAESARGRRWLLVVLLAVAVALAVWDAANGSWGNVVASIVYLAALLIEVIWWPRRLQLLLARADRAVAAI